MVLFFDQDQVPAQLRVLVDVRRGRWPDEPYRSVLRDAAARGLNGVDGKWYHTIITKGERNWAVTADGEQEIGAGHYEFVG